MLKCFSTSPLSRHAPVRVTIRARQSAEHCVDIYYDFFHYILHTLYMSTFVMKKNS